MTEAKIISRNAFLSEKIVILDGIEGCGKTMLAPIVSSIKRVELLTYLYEIEHYCSLLYLNKIEKKAAVSMISMLTDLKLYNCMQGREINFRPSDISSVFRSGNAIKYLTRLFMPGDSAVIPRIEKQRPILSLVTHRMCAFGEPIFEALAERLVFIEIVRHPLYMIKQAAMNFDSLFGSAKSFTVSYQYGNNAIPYFAKTWEDEYIKLNSIDKTIYYFKDMFSRCKLIRDTYHDKYAGSYITIPFEEFVINPDKYMKIITVALGTEISARTKQSMKQQKVPREKYSDSISLDIYKRCGWEAPLDGYSELHEFEYRRNWAKERASPKAMKILDELCDIYESEYMGGKTRSLSNTYI